ncbi:MAG: winged helix-turn-helix domain-containing protein [Pseudomonadota bacterium]
MKINDWQIHPDNCTLVPETRKGQPGKSIRIPPRCMDVLLYLAERPAQVVSTDELLKAFWASPSTMDHAVHKVIASLRGALGDDPHDPHFIKTLPRRGYSLIATVSHEDPDACESLSAEREGLTIGTPRIPSGWRLAGTLATAVLCLVVIAGWLTRPAGDPMAANVDNSRQSAVRRITLLLPTLSLSSPLLQQNQVNALLDSLSASLGRLPEIDVVVADPEKSSGQATDTDYHLKTAIYDTGDLLRLTVNLLDTSSGNSLYADHFTLSEADLPAIEQKVIPTVMESLSIHLDDEQLQEMRAWGTNSAPAYQHFLSARFYAEQFNHDDWTRALEHYEAAIQADPAFINAYLGKATAANNMAVYSRNARVELLSREVMDLGRRLSLEAPDSDAIDTLNLTRMRIEGRNEWHQEREYRKMILEGDAPGYVYARYALYLIGARLYQEADAFLNLARQTENHRISPNMAWNFRTQTLPPSELAEVKVNQLVDRPMHIGILGTAISSLAFAGDLEKARYLLKRQVRHDGDGVRSHLSQILVGAVSGRLGKGPCPHLFTPERLDDPDLAFNNGALFFIQGDHEAGAAYWRQLTRIDRRKLFTRLHAIEPFFPDSIRQSPEYAALLEELNVGASWQHRLMAGVEELSGYTGIHLSPKSRKYLMDGTFMPDNNLWDDATRASVEQMRNHFL